VDEKREDMERFLQGQKVSFATVRDAEQKLVAAVDVKVMPTSLVVDRAGKVRFVHSGFAGEETVKQYRKEIEGLLSEEGR
jgi:predicted transcriptional regulator